MSDKESIDADHLRKAKVLAARKKLKKFQSKKLEQHPKADTESCSSKTSHDEPKAGADGILFSNHGSPLTKRSGSFSQDMHSKTPTSFTAQPIAVTSPPPPPRANPSVIMSSPPPVFQNLVSSPPPPPPPHSAHSPSLASPASDPLTSTLSPPTVHALPPPDHGNPSLHSIPPVSQEPFQLLQNKIDVLQQEKAGLASHSEQLRLQVSTLNAQFDDMKNQKDNSAQQYDALADKQRLLEQEYGEVKQQLLESNITRQSQQEKITELQSALVSAKDDMAALNKERQAENDETQRLEQQQQDDNKLKWEEMSALMDKQKKELDEMKASNEDFHTETTRLIDMVNDLEEELSRTLADNYTKDCEIKSLSTQLYDMARGNHGSLVVDLEQKTQERNTLRQTVKNLEVNQRRLNSLDSEMDVLKERLATANNALATMKHQLDEKDNAIQELHLTLDNKHTDLTTHVDQLSQLRLDHDVIKETADKWQQQTLDIQKLLDEKTNDHADLVAQHDGFETVISELKQQLKQANALSDTKDEQMNDLNISIQQLEQQHHMMKQQLLDTKQIMDGNEYTIDQLRETIMKLEKIHIKLTHDLAVARDARETSSVDLHNMHQQYTALEQTMDEKEALYQDLLKTKDDMARQLDQSQSTHQQHHDLMAERVERINQKVARIMAMYDKMEQTVAAVTAATATATATATAAQDDNASTVQHTKAHMDKLMELESRSLEQQLYISKLETDQQSFEEQRQFLEQQLTSVQDELDEKRELAEMFEDARASLVTQQTSLTSRLEDQQALVSTLNTQLQDRSDEIHELQAKIDTLTLDQQEAALVEIKQTMGRLQARANDLEQQLTSERAASEATNNDLRQQLITLSDNNKDDDNSNNNSDSLLSQQERSQRQEQVELLEKQLAELQDKVQEQQHLYDEKHQEWMAEQTKVTSMTEDISRLQEQLQQKNQQAPDDSDQAATQQQQQHNVDQLTTQLKEAQEQLAAKSKLVEELRAAASIGDEEKGSPENNDQHESEHERALETEVKDLRSRLERQFDAFTTIRGELTTVRDRQLNVELEASKEKKDLIREREGLEHTIERLRNEYQEHLERMWAQHEAIRQHHEEDLTVGRDALDAAQVKLMQNGLSPVSENGFEWVNSDSENDDDNDGNNEDSDGDPTSSHNNNKTPSVGPLPPLRKPEFFEFLETPRCNGCQSEVIDI
ncbi:hypothetical protein BCR42DRAFT_492143 [Absidia repens]|uniref:Uncharacterized protein n=1 Tax=Absidia repens TaxID=90262 RepID=A0A1X2IEX2_9FUNG|nr:hypothetical protein BCR42DRAFT_492143 [Absidia repens]